MQKYILFDLGRVLVDWNPLPYLQKLYVDMSKEDIAQKWGSIKSIHAYETGKISTDEFIEIAPKEFGLEMPAEEFRELFDSWLSGLYPGAIQLVKELKEKGHRIGCLSNINELYANKVQRLGLLDLFDDTFLSYQMGCMKPNAEIYQRAISQIGRHASEILFVDDSPPNVEAGMKAGMESHQVMGIQEAQKITTCT